jgi:hypothetical protein
MIRKKYEFQLDGELIILEEELLNGQVLILKELLLKDVCGKRAQKSGCTEGHFVGVDLCTEMK